MKEGVPIFDMPSFLYMIKNILLIGIRKYKLHGVSKFCF